MPNNVKRLIKRAARMGGLDLDLLPKRVQLSLSERRFRAEGYDRINGYDAAHHFGDVILGASAQYVVEGFIASRLRFIRRMQDRAEIERATFADVGDSSGVFLKALGKRGTSINISPEVLGHIQGLETLQAGLPEIPVPDGAFDYVLCFETLEHLPDPIAGLRELARIARKGVCVSIPFVRRTRVSPFWPDKTRPATEQHVIEFSDTDFRTVLTYAGLHVGSMIVHRTFDRARTPSEALAYALWGRIGQDTLCGVFKRFSVYWLVKDLVQDRGM